MSVWAKGIMSLDYYLKRSTRVLNSFKIKSRISALHTRAHLPAARTDHWHLCGNDSLSLSCSVSDKKNESLVKFNRF